MNLHHAQKQKKEYGDKIPLGIICRNTRPSFGERVGRGRLVGQETDRGVIQKIMEGFRRRADPSVLTIEPRGAAVFYRVPLERLVRQRFTDFSLGL